MDHLRLRQAIALEQLIVRSKPFDGPLTAACTFAPSVDNTTATSKARQRRAAACRLLALFGPSAMSDSGP